MVSNWKEKRKRRVKHIAVLPAIVTLCNAVFGFASIHFAAKGMLDSNAVLLQKPLLTYFAASAWMIFFAMVADALDGFVARKSGGSSDFGAELDSLSDAISFGAAPAFLMLRIVTSSLEDVLGPINPMFGSYLGRLLWLVGAMYVCCTLLRLAKFNVETQLEESAHMNFSGLPSPAAASVIASLVLLHSDILPDLKAGMPDAMDVISMVIVCILPVVTFFVSLLMVSQIQYVHIVNRHLRGRKSFRRVVIIALIVLGLLWKLQLTMAVGSLIYAFYGPIRWIVRLIRKRKHVNTTEKEAGSEGTVEENEGITETETTLSEGDEDKPGS